MKNLLLSCLVVLSAFSVHASASIVAITDSGVDISNPGLRIWTNQGEFAAELENGIDDDGNGYIDDYFGWNFADNNNDVVVRLKYPSETYYFADVYSRLSKPKFDSVGKLVKDLIYFYHRIFFREEVVESFTRYMTYSHGTHVAGIVQSVDPNAVILPLRMGFTRNGSEAPPAVVKSGISFDAAMKVCVAKHISDIRRMMDYAAAAGAEVVNGSWGMGYPNALRAVINLHEIMYGKTPESPEMITNNAHYLMNLYQNAYTELLQGYPQILFVFSAGNSGMSNDRYPHLPSNVRVGNLISVAASVSDAVPAEFTNRGPYFVDVAAPGTSVVSQMPENRTAAMSGTSMSSPYVSGVASRMKEKNPQLTGAELKQILMRTVDLNESFKTIARAGGTVSVEKAVKAAELSLTVTIDEAIKQANQE